MHAAAWQTDSVRCRWQRPTCRERCTGRGTTWRRGWQPLTDIRSDAGRPYSLHARHSAGCACQSAAAPVQPEVLYSGADDCAFKGWDLRQQPDNPTFCTRRDQVGLKGASCAQRGPAAGLCSVEKAALLAGMLVCAAPCPQGPGNTGIVGDCRRAHKAGVCCIAPSKHSEHVVMTGSYDEDARLWDMRQPSLPLCTAQVSCTLLTSRGQSAALLSEGLLHTSEVRVLCTHAQRGLAAQVRCKPLL